MKPIKIGILGGIGPEATGEFYLRLINEIQKIGIKNNSDFPQIIINSIPAPELIYDKISNKDLKFYIKGLKELEEFKVDFIVMICNTIHLYLDKLKKEIKILLIDLKKEIYNYLIKNKIKRITVLGTPNTIKKLYRFKGIKSIDISKNEIAELSKIIFDFNRGINNKDKLKKIVKKYIKKDSMIILGCTELAVILKNEDIPKMDTMDILLESVIKRFRRESFL